MIASSDRVRLYRLAALAAAAFTLVVLAASAYVRHLQYDVRCSAWPTCDVRSSVDPRQPPPTSLTVARVSHRLAATVAALLVVGMLVFARDVERRAAIAALALVVALAGFGAATAESHSPLVALGNLLGGYALFTLLTAAHALAMPAPPTPVASRIAAGCALVLVFAEAGQVALTGSVSAPAMLHRGVALACAALVLAAAWPLRSRRILAAGLVATLSAVVLTGFASPSVASAVLHNASAAVLAALLAIVAATALRPPSGSDIR